MNRYSLHLLFMSGRFVAMYTTLRINSSSLQYIGQNTSIGPKPGRFETVSPEAAHVNADPEDLGTQLVSVRVCLCVLCTMYMKQHVSHIVWCFLNNKQHVFIGVLISQ